MKQRWAMHTFTTSLFHQRRRAAQKSKSLTFPASSRMVRPRSQDAKRYLRDCFLPILSNITGAAQDLPNLVCQIAACMRR